MASNSFSIGSLIASVASGWGDQGFTLFSSSLSKGLLNKYQNALLNFQSLQLHSNLILEVPRLHAESYWNLWNCGKKKEKETLRKEKSILLSQFYSH